MRRTIGYCKGLPQVDSSGHPSEGPYPQGPASNHPPANWAGPAGFVQGPVSGYSPPPPPPTGGHQQHDQGGGFGAPEHRRKMWRNLVLAVVGLIFAGWLILWLLGLLAAKLVNWVPTDVDVAIGEQNWKELAPESSHCTDPGPLAYVEELAQPLIAASNSEFEFHFVVVDAQEVNAFALPGGFVTVNMGLLEAAETGEE